MARVKPSELVHSAVVTMLRACHPKDNHSRTMNLARRMMEVEHQLRRREARGSSYSFGLARLGGPRASR